jgi:hypothetical protein
MIEQPLFAGRLSPHRNYLDDKHVDAKEGPASASHD